MSRPRLLVLLLVVGGLLAAGTLLALQVRADEEVQQARRQALAAASEAAQALLSYDHRTVDDDLTRAQSLTTGRLREEHAASTADLAEQARAGQAVVSATVTASSVVRAEADRVVVLVFADQTTTRKDLAEPRLDQSRLRLVLDRVAGEWRVSSLEAL